MSRRGVTIISAAVYYVALIAWLLVSRLLLKQDLHGLDVTAFLLVVPVAVLLFLELWGLGMRRRGATVYLGSVLLVLLTWQAGEVRVPYVALGPGPTVDTLGISDGRPVIQVTGAETSTSAGQLRLTTVGVQADLTLFEAMQGWLRDDYAVVPRELVYPPDRTEKQVDEENAKDFKESQTSAETAALRKRGYPVLVAVKEIERGLPADGALAAGDVVTAVDGAPVTSARKLTELIRSKPAGTARTVAFTRGGEAKTATLTTVKDAGGNIRVGVRVEQSQPHPGLEIKIDLNQIGGPSAGLMFALGIVDKLDPADLTGGLVIAGTGEIDDDGNVGPIGGIAQKLVAAKRAKARVFLTPAANCAEALGAAQPGLPLVRVATLDDALAALQALRENRQPALCTR